MSTNPNAVGGGSGGQQPYQFTPETYGAVGNGKIVADVVTNSTAVITSATAGWTSADVGKAIVVNGANGAGSLPLITTIASFQSATQVTLAAAATVSASACPAVWGTDDTTAINTAVTAAKNYALANKYLGEIVFGAKIYCLASGPTQIAGPPAFNTQIPVPIPAAAGTTQKLIIKFTGAGDAGNLQYFQSTTPNLQGTVLMSMVQAAATQPDPTFGWQSVLGGPSGSAGLTGSFANVKPVVDGILIVCPVLTRQYAYDFRFCGGAAIGRCSAQAFAAVVGTAPKLPDLPGLAFFQSRGSTGLAMPVTGNNDDCTIQSFAVEGFETGIRADDHLTASRIAVLYFDVALLLTATDGLSGNNNLVSIANFSAEQGNSAILTNGGFMPVDIAMTPEGINTFDISDTANALHGLIRWSNTGGVAVVPAVNSATAAKIINNNLAPGAWAGAPAAPASGVAQQNTSWRDATVYVSSTVPITAVVVATVTTGQTAAANTIIPVWVPSGASYTITAATGTQTTHWVLD